MILSVIDEGRLQNQHSIFFRSGLNHMPRYSHFYKALTNLASVQTGNNRFCQLRSDSIEQRENENDVLECSDSSTQ